MSAGTEAFLALRVRVKAALDALGVPLALDNYRYDPAEGVARWVVEAAVGGPSIVAELGSAQAAPLEESTEQVQYLLRAPADTGYVALREVVDAIKAAVRSPALFLADGITPVVVDEVHVSPRREPDEFGLVSLPVVVSYRYSAPA